MEARSKPVSLLSVKFFAKKLYLWIKAHWQIPLLILWTFFVYLFSKRNTDAIVETLNIRKESYKDQIAAINKAHRNEILKRESLLEEYEKTLESIEKIFKEKQRKLTELQKEMIKDVIIKSKNEPEEVLRKIEQEFGIIYVKDE